MLDVIKKEGRRDAHIKTINHIERVLAKLGHRKPRWDYNLIVSHAGDRSWNALALATKHKNYIFLFAKF